MQKVSVDGAYAQAEAYYHQGAFLDAEIYVQKILRAIPDHIPSLKLLERLESQIASIERSNSNIYRHASLQVQLREEIRNVLAEEQYQDPKNITRCGYKIYSQTDEDGIIAAIFERIGVTNKVFVEFGVDDGLICNTHALLLQGWGGVWLDGSDNNIERIAEQLDKVVARKQLIPAAAFIDRDNINQLIGDNLTQLGAQWDVGSGEIDLLSVDIDGNDYEVFNAISCVNPRAVIMEYNSKFPPPIEFCVDYDPKFTWARNDYMGASLAFLTNRLAQKQYSLVGCNISGVNAFFVRNDLLGDHFQAPHTAEFHFEPDRAYLQRMTVGHGHAFLCANNSAQST